MRCLVMFITAVCVLFLLKQILFISRMPKLCAILQLVSAPLNPTVYQLKNNSGGATH